MFLGRSRSKVFYQEHSPSSETMSEEAAYSEEFVENLVENAFTDWFDAALEEKGLERVDFEKGQVLIRSPFATSQFDDLDPEEHDVEVRVNEDAPLHLIAESPDGEPIRAGDEVRIQSINQIKRVILPEEDQDAAHFTMLATPEGYFIDFNFQKNRSYYEPLLEAADQFLALAEYAYENEMWRGFVESAFHAAERMMKIEVVYMGRPAERHRDVQAQYSGLVRMGMGNEDLADVYNQLHGRYRFSASYVDPRGDEDERRFEFDEELAREMLEVIQDHREEMDMEA